MFHYHVNGQYFFNPIRAFVYAAYNCPHDHVTFDLIDPCFQFIDWTCYPTESYESLYRQRAQQIRNKYDKIILAVSGGTDSSAMVRAFFNNNIHVDAIYIGYYGHSNYDKEFFGTPGKVIQWIKSTWPEQSKHIEIHLIDLINFVDSKYQQSDWVLDQRHTSHFRLTTGVIPEDISDFLNEKYPSSRWALVAGLEKPSITSDGNYAYFVDKTFVHVINRTNIEYFYLNPDMPSIVVKHAHDLARSIRNGFTEYYQLKRAIGQTGDVADVRSKREKEIIETANSILSKLNFAHLKKSADLLADTKNNCMVSTIDTFLKQKKSSVNSWMHGLASIQSDRKLIDYMLRHGYLSSPSQTIQSYNGLLTKKYHLGLQ